MVLLRGWWRRHWGLILAGISLASVVGIALILWIPATNGSKQADLASALLSGVVVGVVLVFVGKAFNDVAEKGQANAAMQVGPDHSPDHDTGNSGVAPGASKPPETQDTGASGSIPAPVTAPLTARVEATSSMSAELTRIERKTFYVEYEDWKRDSSRVDAVQLRLRLFDGKEYFQFVTVVVPAPELRRAIGSDSEVTMGRIWWHIARSIEPQLKDAIRRREIPKTNPTIAYEVEANQIDTAVRQARTDRERKEALVGETLYTFEVAIVTEPG